MTGLLILAAALVGGALGVLLRRRSGKLDVIGTGPSGDRPEVGVHAGFTNHISGS